MLTFIIDGVAVAHIAPHLINQELIDELTANYGNQIQIQWTPILNH